MNKRVISYLLVIFCAFGFISCKDEGISSVTTVAETSVLAESQTQAIADTQTEVQAETQTEAQAETQPIVSETEVAEIVTEETTDKVIDLNPSETETEEMSNKMDIQVGDTIFTSTLENNQAVRELLSILSEGPLVLELDDYSGFEKVGPLGFELTRSDSQTTTERGDIVLYNGSNIVIFYESNSWSYTRLGKIDDLTNLEEALGSGSVTITLSIG